MIEAAFFTANRLFGLSFSERDDVPLYHPDARSWTVTGRDGQEIALLVGDYFARLKARQDDPPFLDVVPIRFAIAEPEGHYHVPLLVTPWSYSTYRGS